MVLNAMKLCRDCFWIAVERCRQCFAHARKFHQHLGPATLIEMDLEGHERLALARDRSGQHLDLFPLQQRQPEAAKKVTKVAPAKPAAT